MKSFIITMKNGERVKVSGRACPLVPWMQTFSHWDEKWAVISEVRTGRFIAIGITLAQAKMNVLDMIHHLGPARFIQRINGLHTIQNG